MSNSLLQYFEVNGEIRIDLNFSAKPDTSTVEIRRQLSICWPIPNVTAEKNS